MSPHTEAQAPRVRATRTLRAPALAVLLALALALALIAAALLVPAAAHATAATQPAADATVNGFVIDEAGVVPSQVEDELNRLGTALEAATPGAEVAVLVVPSLGGLDIEAYSNTRFRQLGIGSEEADNGVLLVVAPNERKSRIEVGYGLEGAIPDGRAGEILRDHATPSFKAGDYGEGIRAAYIAIAREVADEYGAEVRDDLTVEAGAGTTADKESGAGSMASIVIIIGLFALAFFLLAKFGKSTGGRGGGPGGGWSEPPRGGFGGGDWGGSSGGGGSDFGGGSSGGGGASDGW